MIDKPEKARRSSAHIDAVLRVLRRAKRPLSAYDVISALRPGKTFAPPTVYRALEKLIDQGFVHRIESVNAFIACTHAAHHADAAFAICNTCGTVTEFEAAAVGATLARLLQRSGFKTDAATIELHGTCAECRASR